jgi:hypothetical protein
MRVVGLDIHRSFAEAAMLDEGQVRQLVLLSQKVAAEN